MKLVAALAISASIAAAQAPRPAALSVTAVRHWSMADVTRVAIEVSGEFQYKTDRLHGPERVYFDILNSRPAFNTKRGYTETLDDKMVSRIRVAETVPGVTRVVLDLNQSVEATPSQLSNPDRLIIELKVPTNAAALLPVPLPAAPPPPVMPKAEAPKMELAKVERANVAIEKPAGVPPDSTFNRRTIPTVESKPDIPHRDPVTATDTTETLKPIVTRADPPRIDPPLAAPRSLAPPTLAETGKAARHTANGDTSLVRALGLKVGRVVIDPGHGGHDQGTEGTKGLLEKDLVLDIGLRVGKLIEEKMGAEVVYTRSDDTFIPLEGRTALANDKKADLFLSIHANSSPVPRIAGVEVYYLNFPDSKEAADVASRENASSQKSIFELRDIIQKITLHDKAEESRDFAGRMQGSLYTLSQKNFPGIKNRGVKKAPFVVLIGANMPSILAEIGFLTNAREEALLRKNDYRQKLAEALFRGVQKYAESLSHFQVAAAQEE